MNKQLYNWLVIMRDHIISHGANHALKGGSKLLSFAFEEAEAYYLYTYEVLSDSPENIRILTPFFYKTTNIEDINCEIINIEDFKFGNGIYKHLGLLAPLALKMKSSGYCDIDHLINLLDSYASPMENSFELEAFKI